MGEPFHGLSWGELFLFLSMPVLIWMIDPASWDGWQGGWDPYMGQ